MFNRVLSFTILASAGFALSGCIGSDLGIQGGASILAKRFDGIEAVTVTSPHSVRVSWAAQPEFESYSVFVSGRLDPIATSTFDSAEAMGLESGTSYLFTVVGEKSDSSKTGGSKMLAAQTWPPFGSATSAQAVDSSSIRVNWSYEDGPTYLVYKNAGAAPSVSQVQTGPASYTTTAKDGFVATGLAANTLYFFVVVARYPDGTTSLSSTTLALTPVTAARTSTTLLTNPVITATSEIPTTQAMTFTVSGALPTYSTQFYENSIAPANLLATGVGNGTFYSSAASTQGTHNYIAKVTHPESGGNAFYTIENVQIRLPSSSGPVGSVFATTSSSIDPIPVVSAPSVSLSPFPTFTVSGGLSSYSVQIYAGATLVGQRTGNGEVFTLPSSPLPAGVSSITPKVTYLGETITLPSVTVRVRGVGTTPIEPDANLLGGSAGYFGGALAKGDFNCDGKMDVAVGAPEGLWSENSRVSSTLSDPNISFAGAVIVYYGGATGLDVSAAPSTSPLGIGPLLIPAPYDGSSFAGAQAFGRTLAAGNFNNDTSSGQPCTDLAVGAPGRVAPVTPAGRGGVFLYHGSPTGLIVSTNFITGGVACSSPQNWGGCQTVHLARSAAGITSNGQQNFASAMATGDYNGDGRADLAISYSLGNDLAPGNPVATPGYVHLHYGTDFGLNPGYSPIRLPVTWANQAAGFGSAIAFGRMSSGTADDLLIGSYNIDLTAAGFPGRRGGALWLRRNETLSAITDAVGHLNTVDEGTRWSFIKPSASNTAAGAAVAFADVNGDTFADAIVSDGGRTVGIYNVNGGFFVYYGTATGPQFYTNIPATPNITPCIAPSSPPTNNACNPQSVEATGIAYNQLQLGYSITSLGDVNGDAIDDVGVFVRGYRSTLGLGSFDGELRIYYGSTFGLGASTPARLRANPKVFGANGASVVAVDLNGDSPTRPDMILGHPGVGRDTEGNRHGALNTYLGGASTPIAPNTTRGQPDDILSAPSPMLSGLQFDHARFIGDINGDGYTDVGVRAVLQNGLYLDTTWADGNDSRLASWGIVIYYGSPDGLITASATCPAPCRPLSAPLAPSDPKLIVYGPENGPIPQLKGTSVNCFFQAFAPMGDTNRDGYDDLFAISNTSFWFFFGSGDGLITSPEPTAVPALPTDPKTVTVSQSLILSLTVFTAGGSNRIAQHQYVHGDFNADGYSDFAMAPQNSSYDRSPIFVFYGSPNGPYVGSDLYTAVNNAIPHADPAVLSAFKAVNTPNCALRSGSPDFITDGIPRCQPFFLCVANTAGRPCAAEPADMYDVDTWDGKAGALASPGDLNGDGADDLVVASNLPGGTYQRPDLGMQAYTSSGRITIFYGNTTEGLNFKRRVKIDLQPQIVATAGGAAAGDPFNVVPAGDLNGDGLQDLAWIRKGESASNTSTTYANAGTVQIIYGIAGGFANYRLSSPEITCSGTITTDYYPCTVRILPIALDWVANRTADHDPLKVVDMSDTSCNPTLGRCNALRFMPDLASSAVTTFYFGGKTNTGDLGSSVVGPGDLNGDGFDDLVVSHSKNGSTYEGVIVYFGTSTGLRVRGSPSTGLYCDEAGGCRPLVVKPPRDNSYVWSSVTSPEYRVRGSSGQGDVNGDGFPDFIVSSPFIGSPVSGRLATGGFFIYQ